MSTEYGGYLGRSVIHFVASCSIPAIILPFRFIDGPVIFSLSKYTLIIGNMHFANIQQELCGDVSM